jgi:phenylalanyl-tRNA synthetase beta chain
VFARPAEGEALPREERRLGFLLTGSVQPRHWSERSAAADFFTAKGLVEALAGRLDLAGVTVGRREGVPGFLHPGRAAAVHGGGAALGYVGALHPDLRNELELRDEVVVGEIGLEGWLVSPEPPLRVASLDRFPPVLRDLSFLCEQSLEAADLLARIREAGGEDLRSAEIRDRYAGEGIPEGKLSLTVGLRFQAAARTLTGEEVQAAVERVALALRSAGAEIRGE